MVSNARNKSLFIFPAVGIVTVLLVVSILQAIFDWNQRTAWIGAVIAALPLPILMARLMLSRVERTSENLPSFLLLAGAGFIIAIWQQFVEFRSGWQPTAVAGFAALILVLYVFWYSRFDRIASGQLSVGSKLPGFELSDSDGERFHSGSLGGSPAVLLFYRGNWCPLCMAQITEIAERYKDLEALGINVVLISPQPDTASRHLASSHDVPFKFLVDTGNELAESLDIGVKHGVPAGMPGGYAADTVMPTLVVTNSSGTIIFSDQTDNYRVRPEPDVYLAILRRSGAVPSGTQTSGAQT